MEIIRIFRKPSLRNDKCKNLIIKLETELGNVKIDKLDTELCFYVVLNEKCPKLSSEHEERLRWILATPFRESELQYKSFLDENPNDFLIEIGPRLTFSTPFSTNAVSICKSIGLHQVDRLEVSHRYSFRIVNSNPELEQKVTAFLHDRMTEMRYLEPIRNFQPEVVAEKWQEVDILGRGKAALEAANLNLSLAMDDWDVDYYSKMFCEKLKRNPTTVECFDLAQSNSEHSRHWFFKGKLVIDGVEHEKSLIDLVMDTQNNTNDNNVIKFSDNSSAIVGFPLQKVLIPQFPHKCSKFILEPKLRHVIFTAETHNFPTGVAPFSGATTGTGGRIRDVHAAGRGSHVIAGTAGYSFGNLLIPGYKLPWENSASKYPFNFASPLEIAIEASNGASDYGNKYGEPVISGFARSFGMQLPGSGERREWIKPIMFSGGIGSIDGDMIEKLKPQSGMEVAKVGGPVYRIGVGGGSASSVQVQGDQNAELDFRAVQRGDPEMEQKVNRVIRACVEMGSSNPICSIHDQGAGGNGNVLKEIVDPEGAVIFTESFQLGDPTVSTLELWGAEYQESDAILVRREDVHILQTISEREKCPISCVGHITGDKKVILVEGKKENGVPEGVRNPVDLELEFVLGKMPQKAFHLDTIAPVVLPLVLPPGTSVTEALGRVLRLPSVASKRYLTNKVDRSVTALIAQQQCVGPLHTPLADVAVVALSYFEKVGGATSIGEQPIKGMVNAAAGARMAVAEAITNLVFAPITCLRDVKCSVNWMWAAKLPGEGASLVVACKAIADVMAGLGIAVDGGKDSLSMAARVGTETVKAPGTVVVSAYAPCEDITNVLTPDLKCPEGKATIVLVEFGNDKCRLGGSALAQCYQQLGDECPDLEQPQILRDAFQVAQRFLKEGKLISGHDISDGGLVTCILEMAFAGNCGVRVDVPKSGSVMEVLFAEEAGWLFEIEDSSTDQIVSAFKDIGAWCEPIGYSGPVGARELISIAVGGTTVIEDKKCSLMDIWEETSFQLERFQTNPECVAQECAGLKTRKAPKYELTFDPDVPSPWLEGTQAFGVDPSVAVFREEGINGDREMAAALYLAGFQVYDVTMQDFRLERLDLERFQGLVFPGGFSYADVLGSAKGWAAAMLFDSNVRSQMDHFRKRTDTFSLGVCNGCQLMANLGWIGTDQETTADQRQHVNLIPNESGRYESRFVTIRIENSNSIMLKGMEGSTLGVWIGHGEGKFEFRDAEMLNRLHHAGLIALKFVDDDGSPTEEYPMNPNGSRGGLAGMCSVDGRHLALMPHPERCFMTWQWPWMPANWRHMNNSPWIRLFQNAYGWCKQHQHST